MISSTSPSDKSSRADALANNGQPQVRNRAPRHDTLSTDSAARLDAALADQPEVRPEVVERARALAADPSYPSPEIIRSIGQTILAAPDLSEDES